MAADHDDEKRPVTPWYKPQVDVFGYFQAVLGIPDRADTRHLVRVVCLIAVVLLTICVLDWYGDNIGFLGNIRHQVQALKSWGYKGTFRLRSPLTDDQLGAFFQKVQSLGTLDKRDIIAIRQTSMAKKAHDAFFRPRPFYQNPFEPLKMSTTHVKAVAFASLMLQLCYPFIAGFMVWFLMKYTTRYLISAFAGFWLECVLSFVIDWIIAEVRKVVTDIVNVIIKILTFGLVNGAVKVDLPKFSDYFNRWWAKYVKPMLDEMNDEYSCRFETKSRYVAAALEAIMTPVNKLYSWWSALRTYAVDIPFAEFRELVLKVYPSFVRTNAAYADNLEEVETRFFGLLKGRLKARQRRSKNLAQPAAPPPMPSTNSKQDETIVIDLRSEEEQPVGTCQVIK